MSTSGEKAKRREKSPMECLLCTKRNFILSQLAGVLFVAALFISGPDVIPSGMILAGIAMCWAIVATGF